MTTLISSDKRTADATVIGVNGNIVRIQSTGGAIMKNEVAYVCVGEERLKSEVLRIYDDIADVQVLATADEATYSGGTMGADHPIAWCHRNAGGRAFYTGICHPTGDASLTNAEHNFTRRLFECQFE